MNIGQRNRLLSRVAKPEARNPIAYALVSCHGNVNEQCFPLSSRRSEQESFRRRLG